MPDKQTMERVKKDQREGKAPSTQAGEFIREEVHHLREGKHGARSTKQAIAIGLSKARRAGIALGTPKNAPQKVKRQAQRDDEKGRHQGGQVSRKRSQATLHALEKEPRGAGSRQALSKQGHRAAQQRSAASRSASARKAAQTRRKRQ